MTFKLSLMFALAACAVLPISSSAGESTWLKPLEKAPSAKGEKFYLVADGEAKVEGAVIQVIVVKPEHLSVSYKNKTDEALFPRYKVKVYNRYGCLIGSGSVGVSIFGGSSQLEPGDVGGEKISLTLVETDAVFEHAALERPKDYSEAAWVAVSENNF